MYILGLTTMTESAALLLKDGKVIAAVEEERFSRIKHDGGVPYRAIEYVLKEAGIRFSDIDHVAVYWNPYKLLHRARVMTHTALQGRRVFVRKLRRAFEVWQGGAGNDGGWGSLFRLESKLAAHFGAPPRNLVFLDHHTCHMASAFYASPFEKAAILVMDGAGEEACTTLGVGEGTRMRKLDQHLLPHSLGHFYSAITGYLGFRMLDGEYKVMGLSPYGDVGLATWMRKNFLCSTDPGHYVLNTQVLDYHKAMQGDFEGAFVDHFGPPRQGESETEVSQHYQDIAASAQRAFEEVVLDMAKVLRKQTGIANLVIAGGCGQNCVANGKMLSEGIFEKVYVPSAPHDAGGALGAALLLYTQLMRQRPEPILSAAFGPSYNDRQIQHAIQQRRDVAAQPMTEDALVDYAARALSEQKVLAWFQGRLEYGPRALGNRSFLADPRSDQIRDVINAKVKKREPFRPFAPSIKQERAGDYFSIDQPSPFMTIILPVRMDKRALIPAVTHVDGTARPQTVSKDDNPRYWKLLDRFEALTGVPTVLNTSFNIQEPIVNTPEEALDTFCRSGVDALLLGDYVVTRT